MLKAQELRCGNLITTIVPVGGSFFEKHRFDKDILIVKPTFFQIFENNREEETLLKPIPLTEEWLVKFGYENTYGQYYSKNNDNNNCYYELLNVGVGFQVFNDAGNKVVLLESVNHLQNWWYFNNGEELVIK